jgi:hypothetical protein
VGVAGNSRAFALRRHHSRILSKNRKRSDGGSIGSSATTLAGRGIDSLILENDMRRSSTASPNTRFLAGFGSTTRRPRGIAYETDTHFVHLFGKDKGL